METLQVILVVLAVGAAAWWAWWAAKQRREAFQRVALELGLEYTQRDRGTAHTYAFLDALAKGSNRYCANVLSGEFEGLPASSFDYHYETYTHTKNGRQTHHHWFSVFAVHTGQDFPELRVYPEGLFQKLGQALGFDDIDFESAEFSRTYCVKSADKRFAFDVIHQRMMEWLLQNRPLSLEYEGDCIAMWFGRRVKPDEVERRLRQLVEARNLLPDYRFDKAKEEQLHGS